MLIHMRSTLVLDDALYKRARERAVALGTTVSEVVNQALREALRKSVPRAERFEMITFGDNSPPRHHDPADFAQSLEEDDRGSLMR